MALRRGQVLYTINRERMGITSPNIPHIHIIILIVIIAMPYLLSYNIMALLDNSVCRMRLLPHKSAWFLDKVIGLYTTSDLVYSMQGSEE